MKTPRLSGSVDADSELVRRISTGDEHALSGLFDRYGQTVMALASAITHDRTEAEGIVRDTFRALWQEPDRCRLARVSVRAWLLAIAQERAASAVRLRPERERIARNAPVEMPAELWNVVELMYFGGLSEAGVAEQLSMPLAAVRSHAVSGMRLLASPGR